MARRVATSYYQALGGGGGHHHGHHGGGRGPGWGGPGWWGGSPWYDPGVQVFTVDDPICPETRRPVIGADGLVYPNACKARQAGTTVKGPAPMGAWSASMQSDGTVDVSAAKAFWGGVVAGAIGVTLARAILR